MPFSSLSSAVLALSDSHTKGSGSGLAGFLPLLLILVIGYLFLVRPARNRQRQAAQTRSNVTAGSEVTTTAGLIATVVSVNDDDTVTLEVAPGVYSRYVKAAIGRVNTPIEPVDGSHEQIEPDEAQEPPSNGSVSLDKPDPDSPDR